MNLGNCVVTTPEGISDFHIISAVDINDAGFIAAIADIDDSRRAVLLVPRPCASITLRKVGPETVELDGVIDYNFKVDNLSDSPVTVILKDPLPEGTVFEPELNTEVNWQEHNGQLSTEVDIAGSFSREFPLNLRARELPGETIINTDYGYSIEGYETTIFDAPVLTLVVSTESGTINFTPTSNCQEYDAGDDITMRLSPSLVRSPFDRVEYYVGVQRLSEELVEPFEFIWEDAPAGPHVVRALAYAGGTLIFESEPMHLLVGIDGNPVVAYNVMELVSLPGKVSLPRDINDEGVVVGHCHHWDGETTTHVPTRWIGETPEILFDADLAEPWRISNEGVIVGRVTQDSPTGTELRAAFVLDPTGELTVIPMGPSFNAERVYINSKRQVVASFTGNIIDENGDPISVFGSMVWQDGVRHDLLIPGTRQLSTVRAVNITDRGHVIGSCWDYVNREGFMFVWEAPDDLASLRESSSEVINMGSIYRGTLARDANDCGQMIGAYCYRYRYNVDDLSQPAVEEDVGARTNGDNGIVRINDFGQVVDEFFVEPESHRLKSHLRTCGRWLNLNHLIPQDAGWLLVNVDAINNDGVIVGSGLHNGDFKAWKLIPIR